MTAFDWNAESYDRVAGGVVALGNEVLDRLELSGDETVIDAGCGPGTITERLVTLLPRGRVVGIDASPQMVEAARQRLDGRAEILLADLTDFAVDTHADAIFSGATFHWVADHDRLFASLRRALREGGRLVAQCGGQGNIREVASAASDVGERESFAPYLSGFSPWKFGSAIDTEARLIDAGFSEARCWTEERSVNPENPREYLRTVILGAHLDRLPEDLRDPFASAVIGELGGFKTAEYVRLNIDAVA
ncbi:MAG TPA: methyltransferase domain-containing protein [Solirubrobacterales bacterium]|jgi:trans-aconitate 2-methyltransferase|nr:methyltransferase domain-containing protein [Solirubrobacterales bacterium]